MQQELLVSPLVADPAHLGRAAIVGATETWTWHQVHEASIALARRIRGASAVANLCSSRLAFLITLLATLRNRSLMVLPPSGSEADIAAVLNAQPDTIVVGDADRGVDPTCEGALRQGVYVACRPEWKPCAASAADLAWQPAWDAVAVLLHTSGSTGDPQPQAKTLLPPGDRRADSRRPARRGDRRRPRRRRSPRLQRAAAAHVRARVLGHAAARPRHAGARSPSAAARRRRAAFAEAGRAAWIATPMHLRSLVQVGRGGARLLRSPSSRRCRSATRSRSAVRAAARRAGAGDLRLDRDRRARAAPHRARNALVAAGRRAASIRPTGATLGRGAHFASPVAAARRDRRRAERLASRCSAGRPTWSRSPAGAPRSPASTCCCRTCRASSDGVFYLPATGNPAERLCLIYSGPPLERAAARRWLRARLDPVFLPRDFIRARPAAAQRDRQAAPAVARPRVLELAGGSAAAARPAIAGFARARGARDPRRGRLRRDPTRPGSMTSWKAKAERGSAGLIHLIAWIARAAGRSVCRALLVPDRGLLRRHRPARHGAHRASSSPAPPAARPAGRDAFAHLYCFAATLLDRVYMAQRRLPSLRRQRRRRPAGRDGARVGQGLRAARLAPGQLRPHDAEEQGPPRPAGHPPDAHRRARAGAAHRRHRRQQAVDHPARPLRQLPARLRGARARRHRRRARRPRRERGRAERRLLRPAGALSDRPARARGARRRDRPDGLRRCTRAARATGSSSSSSARRRPPAAAARRCSR